MSVVDKADAAARARVRVERPATRWVPAVRSAAGEALPFIASFVLLAASWEAMALWLHSPLVPDLSAILREFLVIGESGKAFREIWVTFYRMGLGFLLAVVLAFPIGIASAVSRKAERFFEPGVILGLTVPGLVWALLCVIWFGVSIVSPVIAVALGVLPSMVITVQQGVRSLSADIVEMTRVFRLKRTTVLRRIWIPLLYASTISGARVGFSIAWKVIVLVEIFGMSNGVGYQLNSQFSLQSVEGVIAWTLAFWLAMMAVEYLVFRPIEKNASHWKKSAYE
ncbi:UNVERIFIED_ORG: NitT/TauT family transport system permease protein [Xanthobacter viscosus]|jgi:NitT/TauT family transport system permease protein|uniref:ABC transporter permease subunit n=1 Tax=Xanthobacter autotrophicus TaxID=280 RepID=A0A6C1KG86_XANAU|nr:ABC transporter permease subunit [Xanthobacter autotrophicus]TLX43289.1 ABC transporter permease subunit [Xanthobacter autotrophicus]